jgi:hypothetical protein
VSSRKNKTGQVVRYLQLAHNEWDAQAGVSRTKVLYSFGREDELDRAAVERLVAALTRLLDPAGAAALGGPADMPFTPCIHEHASAARCSGPTRTNAPA